MKRLVLVGVAALMLVGCDASVRIESKKADSTADEVTRVTQDTAAIRVIEQVEQDNMTIRVIHDQERSATCYFIADTYDERSGVSCLPDRQITR